MVQKLEKPWYVIGFLLGFLLAGCWGGPGFLKLNKRSAPASSSPEPGVATQVVVTQDNATNSTVASVSAQASTPQQITASASGPAAGTTLLFPPGSLAVDTNVSIAVASTVASPSNATQLGIGDSLAQVGTPVSVQSSVAMDTTKPFTVSLQIPSQSGLAFAGGVTTLVVIYQVQDVTNGQTLLGLFSGGDLQVTGTTVSVTTQNFGSYQAAYVTAPSVTEQKVVVTVPILTAQQAAAQPPLTLTSRSLLVVTSGARMVLTGTNFRPTMTLALADTPVSGLLVASDAKASFIVPASTGFGLTNLVATQDGVTTTASVLYTGAKTDHPVSTKAIGEICAGEQFYDASGTLQTGTRNCAGPSPCSSDGQTGCVTTAALPAAMVANVTQANLTSGSTLAGVAGTLSNCSADGQASCVTSAAYPAVKLTNFSSVNVTSGVSVGGVAGTLAHCSLDGALGCVTTTGFPSAKLANYVANDIISGITIGGVTGALFSCSLDGATGCVTTAGFPSAKLANFLASNVTSGTTVAGVPGSLAACTADGQTGCVTSGILPAAAITGFSAWNLRIGTTLGGIAGSLKTNCRNGANSTYFNYDGAVGSLPNTAVTTGTVFDSWDTIDDDYGLAPGLVAGWSSATVCDASGWTDVTTLNGGTSLTSCGSSSTCIYNDRISNLQVTGIISAGGNTTDTTNPLTVNWNVAIATCLNSTYGGYTAGSWRVPTQKEMQSLNEHGIVALESASFGTASNFGGPFWTSTTFAFTPTSAFNFILDNGAGSVASKSGALDRVICIK